MRGRESADRFGVHRIRVMAHRSRGPRKPERAGESDEWKNGNAPISVLLETWSTCPIASMLATLRCVASRLRHAGASAREDEPSRGILARRPHING
jgi:hypothetical protein